MRIASRLLLKLSSLCWQLSKRTLRTSKKAQETFLTQTITNKRRVTKLQKADCLAYLIRLLFITMASSRINAHFVIPVMWFIFNLQRKNKELEIAAGKYTCIQMVLEQNARHTHKCLTTPVSCLWVTDIYQAMSLYESVSQRLPAHSPGFALPQFPVQAQFTYKLPKYCTSFNQI